MPWRPVIGLRLRPAAVGCLSLTGKRLLAWPSGLMCPYGLKKNIYLLDQEGRHGRSPGLEAVKATDGRILREPAAMQTEIFSYFEALFRVATTAAELEPHDTGSQFEPSNQEAAVAFLADLPSLPPAQAIPLDQPFSLCELRAAVVTAAKAKSPGLDGLSYELYETVFDSIGPGLLEA
jgi:hypothetical protein